MENNIDKITDLTEKKPTQAIIYMLLTALLSLSGVIVWQNNKLGNKDEEKEVAVANQLTADSKEISFWKDLYKDMKKEKDDCNSLVVVRTDATAIKDQERIKFLEESIKGSIKSTKKQAVSIQKLSETIPTVKTPTITPNNQTNEN
ncbi:hypothetical protein [Dyadobacter sp. 3J3]|uniref:hypothetical protein n=1 Tax=Dyadobacter sp. 3J3 TaxID=2606600 RepID=UPI00135A0ECC|nr:hypothetical protein [Dyadobacter sp. 3J3]